MNDLPDYVSAGELSAGIGSLLEDAAPPSTMDVALARRKGRAIKNRRRAVAVGSGLAVSGIAAALVAAGLTGPNRSPGLGAGAGTATGTSLNTYTPVPSAGAVTPTPSTSALAISSPPVPTNTYAVLSGTDPIVSSVAFGWLPAGLWTDGLNWSSGTGAVKSTMLIAGTAGGNPQFNLSVLPPGQSPATSWDNGTTSPAPDVNGRTAYWAGAVPGSSAAAGNGQLILEWEYAPNSWAALTSQTGDTTSTGVATIYQVAENVKYNQHVASASPFRLAQAPAGIPLANAGYLPFTDAVSPSGPDVSLSYADSTGSGSTYKANILLIDVSLYKGAIPDPAKQRITVGGHQATLWTTATTTELTVFDVDGLVVEIDAQGDKALADINAAGGIVAYYQNVITLFGPNPTNWTTAVVG